MKSFLPASLLVVLALFCAVSSVHAQIRAESRFNDLPGCATGSVSLCLSCPQQSCSNAPTCIGNLDGEGMQGWTFSGPTSVSGNPWDGSNGPDNFTFWASFLGVTPSCSDGYVRWIDPSSGSYLSETFGYIHCTEEQDPVPLAPSGSDCRDDFLGDWRLLDQVGSLCFDFKTFQSLSTIAVQPFNVTLFGRDGLNIARWEGLTPPDGGFNGGHNWLSIIDAPVEVPLDGDPASGWSIITGSWPDLLEDVVDIHIDLELHSNSIAGFDERTGVDDIVLGCLLLDCEPPTPSIPDIIAALPPAATPPWRNPAAQTRNAFVNQLNAVQNSLAGCDCEGAKNLLRNSIRMRIDGCGSCPSGASDGTDWLVSTAGDCQEQCAIRDLVDQLLFNLDLRCP